MKWGIIRTSLKTKLVNSLCNDYNALAKSFQVANYSASNFPNCLVPCSVGKDLWNSTFPDRPSFDLACTGATRVPTHAPTFSPTTAPTNVRSS